MKMKFSAIMLCLTLLLAVSVSAEAAPLTFDDITFPEGEISFADQVISYEPDFSGESEPGDPNYLEPDEALGTPDYNGTTGSVSLGSGGRITLLFDDNALTGSGDDTLDLHVFEIGGDVEDTFVEISEDGVSFEDAGKVFGSTSSIDIDALGFDESDQFFYVRLTDDPDEGQQSGSTVGADIDSVGAITTEAAMPPTPVIPTPTAAAMGLTLLVGFALRRRRPVHRG